MTATRAALLLLFALSTPACSASDSVRVVIADPAAPRGLRGLDWLVGTWESADDQGAVTEERWTPARGGTMFGISRTTRHGSTEFFEYLRIEEREAGLVYLAAPLGGEAVPFRAVHQGPSRVVFENLEHDDPQRITYWLDPDGELRARIETDTPGHERSAEWRYVRAAVSFSGAR